MPNIMEATYLLVDIPRMKMVFAVLVTIMFFIFLTFYVIYDNANSEVMSVSNFEIIHSVQSNDIKKRIVQYENQPKLSKTLYINDVQKSTRRLPQAIIIGVRKCGTRALLEMLYLHPRVQKAAGEVHFFDRDENYSRGLKWYRTKMPISLHGQVTIEKSPSYFVTPEVPERIRAMNVSVKLLLIVREPVTRAISDYTQLKAHTATASTTSSISSSASHTFEQLAVYPNGTINVTYRPLIISIYHRFLHRWLEVFSREQLLIVNGDLLIEDPVSQLQRIEKFLGLEPKIGHQNFYFNETKGFFCLRNDTADKCLRETKGRKHPRVDPVVINKLRRYFNEHNQRFYDLVGEDLGWPSE